MNLKILLNERKIQKGIKKLSQNLLNFYKDNIYIISVLKGSFIFTADLVRNFPQDLNVFIDFIQVKSYKGKQKGILRLVKDISLDIKNKNILVVDDIFDTGETANFLINYLKNKGAKDVKICTLLYKYKMRKVPFEPHFYAFKIPNYYVVGYGLDFNGKYRHLPYIAYFD